AVFLGGKCAPGAMLKNLSDLEVLIINAGNFDVGVLRQLAVRVKATHRFRPCRSVKGGTTRRERPQPRLQCYVLRLTFYALVIRPRERYGVPLVDEQVVLHRTHHGAALIDTFSDHG